MFYRIVFLIEIPITLNDRRIITIQVRSKKGFFTHFLNELTLSVALYLTFDAVVFFIQT